MVAARAATIAGARRAAAIPRGGAAGGAGRFAGGADALLASVCEHLAGGVDSHLLLGLHERDPLLPLVRSWSAACYTTHVYLVAWDDAAQLQQIALRRVPYLELGTL